MSGRVKDLYLKYDQERVRLEHAICAGQVESLELQTKRLLLLSLHLSLLLPITQLWPVPSPLICTERPFTEAVSPKQEKEY